LVRNRLYVLAVWPRTAATGLIEAAVPSFLFPVLMWAASLLVALVAAELQVLRHIRALRETITQFADGSRALPRLDFETAPAELRDVGEAYERMAESVIHDEAELEDTIHQKEVLLREVHHRVKNNLQLIASIVNMQIRRTKSEEARSIMRSLQDRMLGLATIHNGLYQTADLSELAVDKLFPGIIEQVVRGAQSRGGVRLMTSIDPLALPLDRAVPLALLLTEALSNAMRHAAAPQGEVPVLSVSFRQGSNGEAVLEVTNTTLLAAGDPVTADQGSGIGTQLLRGFARQLGGQFHREFADGLCRVKVWFLPDTRPQAG
jgi:two-component sensor histidine kinase